MLYNSKAEIITFMVNLIFSYLLILTLGFKGAAIGMFFSQLFSKSYLLNITQKISDVKFETKKIIFMIFIYLICSTLISFNSLL